MATIVEQLQTDAVDREVSVATLLRRVKLVAVKLKLPKVEDWVGYELNGYNGEVPSYRTLYGRPKAFNPYRGWIPINGNQEIVDLISKVTVPQSLPSIESLLEAKGENSFYMPYPPGQVAIINQLLNAEFAEMGRDVTRGQMTDIVEQVRNLVLDWALELEKQGILGNETGFGNEEKALASDNSVTIHIGSIGTYTGSLQTDITGDNARANFGSTDSSDNRKIR